MCPHLRQIMECYQVFGELPPTGYFVVCRGHGQVIIHGDGFWILSDDPQDIEDCYAGR